LLADIDEVTAPPGAEQPHQNYSPTRPHIAVGGTVALLDDQLAASGVDYKAYSTLAGPLARPRWDEPYQVQYRKIHRNRTSGFCTGSSSSPSTPTSTGGSGTQADTRP
jgi:hypothetical protein